MIKSLPINDTTYEAEMLSGDKVEIGDKEAIDFKPSIKLNRWNGECFIKVGLPTTRKIPPPVVEADKVKWRTNEIDVRIYPLEPDTNNEFGGFEFEITLKERLATNEIVLDLEAQGLRFSYQPPLTQQQMDEGCFRPDNVIGSYAVYHATKKNNQYMTGKAFHIYRPQAEDAEGKKVWCSLHIDGYLNPKHLTITIPQQFLDEAKYPITIDPDLGYTSRGSGNYNISQDGDSKRGGEAWTMPAGGGTANYIKAYLSGSSGIDCDVKAFINQKDSEGANSHGQIATKENLQCAEEAGWKEFTLASEALAESVAYILNVLGNGADTSALFETYQVAYDENGTGVASYRGGGNYGTPENPWTHSPDEITLDFSIYCNYTAAGAVGLENKSANMGSKMVAAGLI